MSIGYQTRRARGTYTRAARFPMGPLVQIWKDTVGAGAWGKDPSAGQLAAWLGTTRRQIFREQADGISDRRADEYAARIGRHMCDVWPDEYAQVLVSDLIRMAKGNA